MNTGTFVLHRFNGDEVYQFSDATILAYHDKDNVYLCFEVDTQKESLKSLPDTVELAAHPNAEVTIILDKLIPNELVGTCFSVPSGYDEHLDEWRGRIYYCEHEALDNNHIEILARKGEHVTVRWTGTTIDVNYYDGSKPVTKVEIEGTFVFKDLEEWTKEGT
jgi:RNase P/RNase MRP subunit p29